MSKSEQHLREEIAKCWDDPLRYVLLAFPWGQKGTPLEKFPDGPDEWQKDQLNAIRDHIRDGKEIALRDATTSGHGIGKSTETAWVILWFCSTRPHCAGRITAGTQAQLNSTTWRELSVWHQRSINKHWFKWTATRFFAVESPETWGVTAIAWSEHNSDAFAGLHAEHVLVIFDEASTVADIIWEVTEGAMTTPGAFWFVYGNPVRNTGRFRECFRSMRHRWNTRQVDSRTCRMTNKAEIDQWADDYGEDSDFFRVRVKGQFPRASSSQLINEDTAEAARLRVIPKRIYERYPVVIGVDVARYGDDRTVIVRRQGPKVWMPETYREISTMEVAAKAYEAWQEHKADAVCVDGIGVGAGVVDRLEELGAPVVDVQSAARAEDPRKYFNTRAEIWCRMAEWLHDAALPDDKELILEMTAIEYGYNANMQIVIERTEDLKKRINVSPDLASALAMTMADSTKIARALSAGQRVTARPVANVDMGAWT
ncbi:terminase [Marinobacter sp. OP 3.4]|uniref:terminase n=1 Tax=Marinobacter sp. OP 3.4 TaxID=3076501 RepID=UPI002E2302D9